MNWNKDRSITLSRLCIIIFSFLLLFVDITGYWLSKWFVNVFNVRAEGINLYLLLATIYLCSIFAWVLLLALWRLLKNLRAEEVFIDSNVRHLRIASWCCVGISAICFASAFYYIPLILIAIAAGFIALIVRIVKNVFAVANAMKYELDLTV